MAEWLAYWALQGDEPEDCLAAYMKQAAQDGCVHEFLIHYLADCLDQNGASDYQLKLVRRKRGKPINRMDRALRGHRAAGVVERLVNDGVKQEAAIAQASEETGLSRAEIFTWLKHRRTPPSDFKPPKMVTEMLDAWKARQEESTQKDE